MGVGVSVGIWAEVVSGAVVRVVWIAGVVYGGDPGSRDGAWGASPWVQAATKPRTTRQAIKVTFKAAPVVLVPPFGLDIPGS